MPRHQRILSKTAMYHIVMRGNEKKDIFLDEQDFKFFIETLLKKAKEENAEIYAYCLMNNHVHILLKMVNDLSKLMKRINVTYVNYFNKKYNRVGHLFQDRFYSENIESDEHLLDAIRYIHNNPLKAGLVANIADYPYSSYNWYIYSNYHNSTIEFILKMFSDNKVSAIAEFIKFSTKDCINKYFDDDNLNTNKENEARIEFENKIKNYMYPQKSTIDMNNNEFNQIIIEVRKKYNLSIRQVAKITGISRSKLQKIITNEEN